MIAASLCLASVGVSFAALFLPSLGQAMGTTFLLFGCALYGEWFDQAVSVHVYTTMLCVLANFLIIPRNGDFARLNFFGVALIIFQGYYYFWTFVEKSARDTGRLVWTFMIGGIVAVFIDVWNSAYWTVDDPAWASRRQGAWCAFNFARGYGALLTMKRPTKKRILITLALEILCVVLSLAAQAWSQAVAMIAVSTFDLFSAAYVTNFQNTLMDV